MVSAGGDGDLTAQETWRGTGRRRWRSSIHEPARRWKKPPKRSWWEELNLDFLTELGLQWWLVRVSWRPAVRHQLRFNMVNVSNSGPEGEPLVRPDDEHRIRTDDEPNELPDMINAIRAALSSMSGGEINVSAYDTALVALVNNLDGGDGPQFPSSIDWIVQNQLSDGSWGDEAFYLVQDRIINTLACVVALKSWKLHSDKCEKGMRFIREHMWRLGEEVPDDWTLIGFEITFPWLLSMAKDLGLDIPQDDLAMEAIHTKRNQKLNKIPTDVMHAMPTSLLYSAEGMVDLDWKRLLEFRCSDGSFHQSPGATAYSLNHTGDRKSLEFIDGIVKKYRGGVPCVYPVDLFECLWAVDRLIRLGISRHFTGEIKQCLDYTYRHWSEEGLSHSGTCPTKDIDDTAMGFRLLRLHGYHVTPCAFKKFEKDGQFFCYGGQTNNSVTGMYNTLCAVQLAYPGEDDVLRRANQYCRGFLQDRRATNTLSDKWVISPGLPGEVGYALDFPWKASLPRVETRFYLEQYGGSGDVWIGKVLYRMPLFCNETYLKAAKADFTNFQRMCRFEWHGLRRWYDRNKLQMYGVSPNSALRAYFLATANVFEQNRAEERLAWARTTMLTEALSSYFQGNDCAADLSERLTSKLSGDNHNNLAWFQGEMDSAENSILNVVDELITSIGEFEKAAENLLEPWKDWLNTWTADDINGSCEGSKALLLVRTVEVCSGRYGWTEQPGAVSEYTQLEQLTSSICRKLAQRGQRTENSEDIDRQLDVEMRELAHHVLQISRSGISRLTKQTFLDVVKSFYYVAICSSDTIDFHMFKVLFEDVI